MTEAGGLLPDIIAMPAVHVMNTETGLDSVAPDPNPMTTAIGVDQGHSTGLPNAIFHMTEAQAPTTAVMTHPTTDIPLTGMPPEMTADLAIDLENTTTNWPEDLHHLHTLHHGSLMIGNINKSQSMTHHQITMVQMTMKATLMMI